MCAAPAAGPKARGSAWERSVDMEISRERDLFLEPVQRDLFDVPGECEGAELDVEDAFGAHDIEYWVRRGNRLVPAAAEDIAQIQEWERELAAHARLERWRRDERRAQRWRVRFLRRALARCEAWMKWVLHHDTTRATTR